MLILDTHALIWHASESGRLSEFGNENFIKVTQNCFLLRSLISYVRIKNNTCNNISMKKKLTLVIDDEVIERAKRFAKSKDLSVSEIVENYLIHETRDQVWSPPAGSVLSRITGAVSQEDPELSDDERREKALRNKHA